MPFIKLNFRPGVNRDQTNYSNEGGWYDCDKIRFRSGFPEKIGGWVKQTTETFTGVCRQMWNWVTSFSDDFLAVSTNSKLYIEVGGVFYNITPIRESFTSPDTDDCVETINGSADVTINLTGHGANDGDTVIISGVTGDVGGIPDAEINTSHIVQVVDANTFIITVSTAATSDVAAGGGSNIDIEFEIEPGNRAQTLGYGWGTGTWGRGYWGLGSTQPVLLPQRDWWLDNFDNDLVANVRNGAIYYWERGSTTDPTSALETRAFLLSDLSGASDVPSEAMQVLVSQNDKHLIALGATPYGGGSFDPLLIRWTNQDDPGNWTPEVTNSAGFLRVSRGSRIIRGLATRQEILVWTDASLYSLQFLGTTDVFGLQELGDNTSIIGPRATISVNNVAYWMGVDKFYAYSGRVETLPCTLRNYVFLDLNYDQADQIICGTNEGYNEVWWIYPSADSNWNNRYVIYNHLERVWYYGNIERTAWLDSSLRQYPQSANTGENAASGYLYFQENGVDDDGAAMVSYIQSSDFDLADGDQFMLSRRMLPDINFNGSTATEPEVTLQIRPRNFPGTSFQGDVSDSQPVIETSVDVYTEQVFIRARARQMALKVSSADLGVQWQLGSPRLDVRPDGKR